MEATQLNVRISPELKARGDEALSSHHPPPLPYARSGPSPSPIGRTQTVCAPSCCGGRDNNEERQADIERRLRSLHEGWTARSRSPRNKTPPRATRSCRSALRLVPRKGPAMRELPVIAGHRPAAGRDYLGTRPGSGEARSLLDAAIGSTSICSTPSPRRKTCTTWWRRCSSGTAREGVPHPRRSSPRTRKRPGASRTWSATPLRWVWTRRTYGSRTSSSPSTTTSRTTWWSAARRAKADYLVTNDERLLRHSPVAALSPRDMLALLRSLAESRRVV